MTESQIMRRFRIMPKAKCRQLASGWQWFGYLCHRRGRPKGFGLTQLNRNHWQVLDYLRGVHFHIMIFGDEGGLYVIEYVREGGSLDNRLLESIEAFAGKSSVVTRIEDAELERKGGAGCSSSTEPT